MTMAPRVFFGIHSAPSGLVGMGIRTATELNATPPWILGPAHPATHAFLAWGSLSEGPVYRLDGDMPRARLSLWTPPEIPTALWEMLEGQEGTWRRAVTLVGVPYDHVEALAQLLPGAGKFGFWEGGTICTGVALEALREGGRFGRELVTSLPNRLPEVFGQALQAWTGRGFFERLVV